MVKVKLLKIMDNGGHDIIIPKESITDWDEISLEDYQLLKDRMYDLYTNCNRGETIVLIENLSAKTEILNIKSIIETYKAEELEIKNKLAQQKQKRDAKKLEREKQKFLKLKEKYKEMN